MRTKKNILEKNHQKVFEIYKKVFFSFSNTNTEKQIFLSSDFSKRLDRIFTF